MFARRRDVLEREADRLGGLAVRGDVTVPNDLERLVEQTIEAFGGVDIVVHNSGGPPRTSALEMSEENVEAAVQLLLISAVRLTALCLPPPRAVGRRPHRHHHVQHGQGAGRQPRALERDRPGVVGWSKTLSRELGPKGITVNCIAPGRIDTERIREVYPEGPTAEDLASIPLGRLGRPSEIGGLVSFLCSDRGSYISGVTIPVDGGLLRSIP